MHDPMSPHSTLMGQSFDDALFAISLIGVARSGVNGPLTCGESVLDKNKKKQKEANDL